jgi:hypothetical protein
LSPSRQLLLAVLLLAAPLARAGDPPPPGGLVGPPQRAPVAVPATRHGAQPTQGDSLEDSIFRLRSPYASAAFLQNTEIQAIVRQRDAALFERLFVAATEIADVQGFVTGIGDAGVVRSAIVERPRSCFCQRPMVVLAWYDDQLKPIYGNDRRRVLEDALLEWERLPPAVQRALQARRGGWSGLTLDERFAALKTDHADRELAAVLATVPRSDSELRALRRRAEALDPLLVDDDSRRLQEHLTKASALVAGLNDAARRVGRSSSPELRDALAAARGAGTVEAALAGLDRVFDGLGVRNAQVDRQRPSTEAESLTPDQRAVLATTLRTSLLRSIAGTTAGDELIAFYRDTPLNIRIEQGPPSANGWFMSGTDDITINERRIEEFVRTQGRSAMDLTTDPALLQRMTWLLAPLFVHEATHHRQDRWARANGLPSPPMQQKEREAHVTDTLFTMELSRRNPEFLRTLRESAPTSSLADGNLRKVDRMNRLGLDFFRQSIDAWHYADTLSLEGHAWCAHVWHREPVRDLEAELERRRALPAEEQARLERGPDPPDRINSEADWRALLAATGTPQLRAMLERRGRQLSMSEPRAYEAYRRRFAEFDERSRRQFDTIMTGGAAPERPLGTSPPPPPPR